MWPSGASHDWLTRFRIRGRSHYTTINQYLAAGLIDELRLHIVLLTFSAGTRLFEGAPPLKFEQVKSQPRPRLRIGPIALCPELEDYPQVLIIAPPHGGN